MNKNNLKLTDFEFKNDNDNDFLKHALQTAVLNASSISIVGKRGTSEIRIWINSKPNEDFMDSLWDISFYGETGECMAAARFVPTHCNKKYFCKAKDSNKWYVNVDAIAELIKNDFAERWL